MEAPRTRIVIDAYLRQQGMCPYCQGTVDQHNATWEHIIPRSWGGPNTGFNIILACEPCNSAKSAIESLISNKIEFRSDTATFAALFMMRCMKLNRKGLQKVHGLPAGTYRLKKGRKLPAGTYLRMAESMQKAADTWIHSGQVAVPGLDKHTRGAFI